MERKPAPDESPMRTGDDAAPGAQPAVIASDELLRGGRMVEIRHNGEVYRLQTTKLGKLILTK